MGTGALRPSLVSLILKGQLTQITQLLPFNLKVSSHVDSLGSETDTTDTSNRCKSTFEKYNSSVSFPKQCLCCCGSFLTVFICNYMSVVNKIMKADHIDIIGLSR